MKEIGEIADVVEFRTWAGRESYTFNSIKEELEAAAGEDEDESAEELAQKVMDELVSRQQILGDAYPFKCDGYKLEFSSSLSPEASTYLFCLGLSTLPAGEISSDQRSIQFETIAMRAAQGFYGGSSLRIGAPWRTDDIPTYAALLDRVLTLIPNLGPPIRDAAPAGGDCGWDVLIVKEFADKSFPRLIILGNCATGRTDWMKKGMDVQPGYFFQSSFTGDPRSVVITFFAVPFCMDDDARLRKLYDRTVTFDRFRICEHAPTAPQEIAEWIESTRSSALQVPLN